MKEFTWHIKIQVLICVCLQVSLYHSAKSTEGSLELSTTPMKNLYELSLLHHNNLICIFPSLANGQYLFLLLFPRNIVYGGRIGAFGIIPILSMNRVIDSTFSVNSSTTLVGSDISDANFGFVKVLPKLGVRIDGDINIQDSELNTDLIASKDINKKFSIIFVHYENLCSFEGQKVKYRSLEY